MADIYGLKGKKVFVLGLAKTGQATARALQDAGVLVAGWDDSFAGGQPGGSQGLAVVEPAAIDWSTVAAMIKSPGIPLTHPAVQAARAAGVKLVSDFDLLFAREQGRGTKFIGITGTNGKSTVTALVGHILRANGVPVAVGGNIGTAALSLPSLPAGGVYVLECSSYQLEMTSELRVDAGVVLNLTPDHLARHGTLAAYRDVKLRLLQGAWDGAVKVLGVDQAVLADVAGLIDGVTTLSVAGHEAAVRVDAAGMMREGDAVLADLHDLPNLPGAHNWQNVAAALLLCRPWVEVAYAMAAVRTFKGLPHRLEILAAAIDGVRFVNNSKATNGDSTLPALRAFGNIFWICGGRPKSDGLGAAVEALENVQAAFCIGEAGADFAAELKGLAVPAEDCGTLAVAVAKALAVARAAQKPAWVVLSPACASQDQFRDFEERGEVFRELVAGVAAKN